MRTRTFIRGAVAALVLSAGALAASAGTAHATISSTNTTNDATNITYAFQYSAAGSFYRTYIDTGTGSGFSVGGIHANYLLENNHLYPYVGPGWAWGTGTAVTYTNTANTASWTISRSSVGETNCTSATAQVVFEVQNGSTFDTSAAFTHNFVPCASAIFDSVTTNDATNIHYSAGYSGAWSFFQVFIDADANAGTGYATGGLGADYFIENGTLHKHTGGPGDWTWTTVGSVTYTNSGSNFSYTVARSSMPETQTHTSETLFYRVQSSSTSAQLATATHVYWGGSTGGGGSGPTGTIVPLYSYPTNAAWSAIVSAKNAHPTVPVVAVVNPNNGPGTSVDSNYTTGIANLQAAGITVIGYVFTSYGARAESAVQADMNTWKSLYPAVTGIFFDEMSNHDADIPYYQRQDSYARSKGFTYTVGNPGTDTTPNYVGVVNTILVYESSGLATLPTWYTSYAPGNFGVIPYNVPSLDTNALNYIANNKAMIGYIYLTDDNLPNPWDTLSSYFSSLLGALQ